MFLLSGLTKPPGIDSANEHVSDKGEDSIDEEVREQHSDEPTLEVHLTPFELEGLWNLLGKLESLPSNKKGIPVGIHNAPALVAHIKVPACVCVIFLHHRIKDAIFMFAKKLVLVCTVSKYHFVSVSKRR